MKSYTSKLRVTLRNIGVGRDTKSHAVVKLSTFVQGYRDCQGNSQTPYTVPQRCQRFGYIKMDTGLARERKVSQWPPM